MNQEIIKILVADDHSLMRSGIKSIVAKRKELQIVSEAVDGFEAVKRAEESKPDIILMDIRMPRLDGLKAIKEIIKADSETRIIVISALKDEEYIIESFRSGAKGYVLKDSVNENLLSAIDSVLSGKTYLDKNILGNPLENI